MARRGGRVDYFRLDKGFGFIRPDGGGHDVFVHQNAIAAASNKLLKRGDRVEFDTIEDARGPRAQNVHKLES